MKKSYQLILAFVLIVLVASVFLFVGKPTPPSVTEDSEKTSSESSYSVVDNVAQNVKIESQDDAVMAAVIKPKSGSKKTAATMAPEKAYLEAETSLFVDRGDAQGMNVKTAGELMKGNNFHNFMDSLTKQSSGSTQALDITNLYGLSAQNANHDVNNAVNYRVACGLIVCGISANSPTKDDFDAWFAAFIRNKSSPPYALGRYDVVNDNGIVEYRMVFSSDPQRNRSIMKN